MNERARTTVAFGIRAVVGAAVIGGAGLAGSLGESDPLAAGLTAFALIPVGGAAVGIVDGWTRRLSFAYAAWLVIALIAAVLQQLVSSVYGGIAHGGTTIGMVAADVVELAPFTALLLYAGVALGLLVGGEARRMRRPHDPLPR